MSSNDIEIRDKAILEAIAKLSTDLNGRMDRLEKDVTEIKIAQAELKGEIKALDSKIDAVEGKLIGEIKALDNKIDGLDKRVSLVETRVTFQGNWFLGIITALGFGIIGSIFTAIFKFVG